MKKTTFSFHPHTATWRDRVGSLGRGSIFLAFPLAAVIALFFTLLLSALFASFLYLREDPTAHIVTASSVLRVFYFLVFGAVFARMQKEPSSLFTLLFSLVLLALLYLFRVYFPSNEPNVNGAWISWVLRALCLLFSLFGFLLAQNAPAIGSRFSARRKRNKLLYK